MGPTLPGLARGSVVNGVSQNILTVSYRDLYPDQYKPRGHLEIELFISAIGSTNHIWEARWAPPSPDWDPVKIQLYPTNRVAVQSRTIRTRWPKGHSGAPYVLQVSQLTNRDTPWSILVVPIATYIGQPAFLIDHLGQITPQGNKESPC